MVYGVGVLNGIDVANIGAPQSSPSLHRTPPLLRAEPLLSSSGNTRLFSPFPAHHFALFAHSPLRSLRSAPANALQRTRSGASDTSALEALADIEPGDVAVLLSSAAYSTYTVRLSRSASRAPALDLAAGKTLVRTAGVAGAYGRSCRCFYSLVASFYASAPHPLSHVPSSLPAQTLVFWCFVWAAAEFYFEWDRPMGVGSALWGGEGTSVTTQLIVWAVVFFTAIVRLLPLNVADSPCSAHASTIQRQRTFRNLATIIIHNARTCYECIQLAARTLRSAPPQVPGSLATWLQAKGQSAVSGPEAQLILAVTPVVAVTLAAVFLGEEIAQNAWCERRGEGSCGYAV